MAFNFNWAPLSGDPGFYKRAEELLTDAMNKNPKPPIIVDDIIVTELNLGDIPPDLEVVEISDIGVDKFRGTFKMSYVGNAFITIKTRVQANPLNTYLITRPAYASPRPLAAAAGLTIPLQITLSDFKLSAIIILVFSRQKGLTIVFRNDPLESLKVSSTFDSIPFVANYLQQVIEGQLRTLFMDELPAIIHRMSLRLWVPEHKILEERVLREEEAAIQDEPAVDPLASQPEDPVDANGTTLSPSDVVALSLDSHIETQSLFSRKNLLRLATLTDSHRTLSLFTPNIQDAVFRAWTGPLERGEVTGSHSRITTPALSRSHSYSGSISTSYTFDHGPHARPHVHSYNSSTSISSIGGHHLKSHKNRKRKKRVVNLRKQPETGEMEAVIEDGSTITDSTSVTDSYSDGPSIPAAPTTSTDLISAADPVTPPRSPHAARHRNVITEDRAEHVLDDATPQARPQVSISSPTRYNRDLSKHVSVSPIRQDNTLRAGHRQRRVVNLTHRDENVNDETPKASMYLPARTQQADSASLSQTARDLPPSPLPHNPRLLTQTHQQTHIHEKQVVPPPNSSEQTDLVPSPKLPNFLSFITDSSNSTSIAERAWMMKMATEVARRYEEERVKGNFEVPQTPLREDPDDQPPPPAYAR